MRCETETKTQDCRAPINYSGASDRRCPKPCRSSSTDWPQLTSRASSMSQPPRRVPTAPHHPHTPLKSVSGSTGELDEDAAGTRGARRSWRRVGNWTGSEQFRLANPLRINFCQASFSGINILSIHVHFENKMEKEELAESRVATASVRRRFLARVDSIAKTSAPEVNVCFAHEELSAEDDDCVSSSSLTSL